LISDSTPPKQRRILQTILELESLGAEIEIAAGDVSDAAALGRIVQQTLDRCGTIHGVIHAAGILRAGLIQVKDETTAGSVMAPKIEGTLALYDAIRNLPLDFLVLFSSLASVTMPYAHVDYCAANAFLDAFAWYGTAHGPFPCLTINWPMWREVGILADLEAQAGVEDWKEEALAKAILTREGIEVFKRALACGLPQLVVSPEPLDRASTARRSLSTPAPRRRPDLRDDSRPATSREKDEAAEPSGDEVEHMVGEIWSKILGLERIGLHEQFADLGGHSLLAMQIVSKIRGAYQTTFTLRDFFQGPTIAQVSSVIRQRLTAEIEHLSEDEVKRQLAGG
jgi:hypothetical protein